MSTRTSLGDEDLRREREQSGEDEDEEADGRPVLRSSGCWPSSTLVSAFPSLLGINLNPIKDRFCLAPSFPNKPESLTTAGHCRYQAIPTPSRLCPNTHRPSLAHCSSVALNTRRHRHRHRHRPHAVFSHAKEARCLTIQASVVYQQARAPPAPNSFNGLCESPGYSQDLPRSRRKDRRSWTTGGRQVSHNSLGRCPSAFITDVFISHLTVLVHRKHLVILMT